MRERLTPILKNLIGIDFKNSRRGVSEQAAADVLPEALRKEFEKPTVSSLLDLDFYKLTMGQFVWEHKKLRNVPVTYEFKNRAKDVRLTEYIPQDVLEAHLKHIQNMHIT